MSSSGRPFDRASIEGTLHLKCSVFSAMSAPKVAAAMNQNGKRRRGSGGGFAEVLDWVMDVSVLLAIANLNFALGGQWLGSGSMGGGLTGREQHARCQPMQLVKPILRPAGKFAEIAHAPQLPDQSE